METIYSQDRVMGVIVTLKDGGYGFIISPGHDPIFFHSSELLGTVFQDLKRGTSVEFRLTKSKPRPKAVEIIVVSDVESERKNKRYEGDK